MSFVATLLTFALPETLTLEKRNKIQASKKQESSVKQLIRSVHSSYFKYLILIFVITFGLQNYETIYSLYVKQKYGFNSQIISTIITLGAVIGIIVQAGLIDKVIVTFYKHFKSIDELVFEVQMNILRHMVQSIRSEINNELSGKEIIQNMLYAWINFAKKYRDEMKFIFLFDFYYGVHESNEELKLKYKNFIFEDNSSNFFNEAINKGISDKSLKQNLDAVFFKPLWECFKE